MNDQLLAQLSDEDLALPEYYPLNLSIAWVAYGYKPLPTDYAYIVYDSRNLDKVDHKKFEDAQRAIHFFLRSGKIRSRYYGVTDHWSSNYYYEDDWKTLKAIEWSGSISGHDCRMFYLSEDEQINLTYHNIEINLSDLLAIYPLNQAKKVKCNAEITQIERRSFYKLIYGMAKAKYKYSANDRNSAVANIKTSLLNMGITLDDNTIRKYLRDAAEFVEADNEK